MYQFNLQYLVTEPKRVEEKFFLHYITILSNLRSMLFIFELMGSWK